jgi:hypothetical protein
MATSRHGIRIIFKRDSESSIGRGCILYRGHFRPEVIQILYFAALHAPGELGNEMWVTEGWRNIRDSRDMHEELRAFDLDCMRIVAENHPQRYSIAQAWGKNISDELGPDYQIILHGGETALHLHIELDP